MSIATELHQRNDRLSPIDRQWFTFVYDHRQYIRKDCAMVIVDGPMVSRFQHKIDHLLRSNNCDRSILWIGRLINSLDSLSTITIGTQLFIPGSTQIEQLYRVYQTSSKL